MSAFSKSFPNIMQMIYVTCAIVFIYSERWIVIDQPFPEKNPADIRVNLILPLKLLSDKRKISFPGGKLEQWLNGIYLSQKNRMKPRLLYKIDKHEKSLDFCSNKQ